MRSLRSETNAMKPNKIILINSEESSNKFWIAEKSEDGLSVVTKWGRLGLNGQSKTEDTGADWSSDYSISDQVRSKINKGYVEVSQKTFDKLTVIASGIGSKNKMVGYSFLECGKKIVSINESQLVTSENPGIFVEIEDKNKKKFYIVFTAEGAYDVSNETIASFSKTHRSVSALKKLITENDPEWEFVQKVQQSVMSSII